MGGPGNSKGVLGVAGVGRGAGGLGGAVEAPPLEIGEGAPLEVEG